MKKLFWKLETFVLVITLLSYLKILYTETDIRYTSTYIHPYIQQANWYPVATQFIIKWKRRGKYTVVKLRKNEFLGCQFYANNVQVIKHWNEIPSGRQDVFLAFCFL